MHTVNFSVKKKILFFFYIVLEQLHLSYHVRRKSYGTYSKEILDFAQEFQAVWFICYNIAQVIIKMLLSSINNASNSKFSITISNFKWFWNWSIKLRIIMLNKCLYHLITLISLLFMFLMGPL